MKVVKTDKGAFRIVKEFEKTPEARYRHALVASINRLWWLRQVPYMSPFHHLAGKWERTQHTGVLFGCFILYCMGWFKVKEDL